VVSVTTVISVDHQVNGIVSGQALECVQVHPQILRFVIDRDLPAAESFRNSGDDKPLISAARPSDTCSLLIEADGDVHQGIPFVQRDVGQPLSLGIVTVIRR